MLQGGKKMSFSLQVKIVSPTKIILSCPCKKNKQSQSFLVLLKYYDYDRDESESEICDRFEVTIL